MLSVSGLPAVPSWRPKRKLAALVTEPLSTELPRSLVRLTGTCFRPSGDRRALRRRSSLQRQLPPCQLRGLYHSARRRVALSLRLEAKILGDRPPQTLGSTRAHTFLSKRVRNTKRRSRVRKGGMRQRLGTLNFFTCRESAAVCSMIQLKQNLSVSTNWCCQPESLSGCRPG
jgi:hypothetical protein